VNAVMQDFFVCMYLTNVVATAKRDADEQIAKQRKEKCNKHQYRANINDIIGTFKDRFILACLENSTRKSKRLIRKILLDICASVVPVRPGRSVLRNPFPRKVKFFHNIKSNC